MHNDCAMPPPNATQEEINKFYWEWCYGPLLLNNDNDNTTTNNNDISSSSAVGGENNGGGKGGGGGGSRWIINGGLGMRTAPAKSWYVFILFVGCVDVVCLMFELTSK